MSFRNVSFFSCLKVRGESNRVLIIFMSVRLLNIGGQIIGGGNLRKPQITDFLIVALAVIVPEC